MLMLRLQTFLSFMQSCATSLMNLYYSLIGSCEQNLQASENVSDSLSCKFELHAIKKSIFFFCKDLTIFLFIPLQWKELKQATASKS